MNNKEIALAWAKAERLAERIWSAYITGVGVEQARKDQKSLVLWLGMVREYGLVYNGCFDEYVILKI
jgi:hypothetical protein